MHKYLSIKNSMQSDILGGICRCLKKIPGKELTLMYSMFVYPVWPAHHTEATIQVLLRPFPTNTPGKAAEDLSPWALSRTWETRTEFLASGFGLAYAALEVAAWGQ